jgi:hypothetical protein
MPIRNVPKEIKELLSSVATQMKCEYQLVEDVYIHEFDFVARKLTVGEKNNPKTFENILLKHFGSFISNEKYINKLKQIQDEKERKQKDIDCL